MPTTPDNRSRGKVPRDRWQRLPRAFRAVDVMRTFGLTQEEVTEALYRWHREGHISRLGKRLDVYANNAKCEEGDRVPAMLHCLHDKVTYCGNRVLNSYGWTTQTPTSECVLVPKLTRNMECPEERVLLYRRPRGWWRAVFPYITDAAGTPTYPVRHLPPEWLLAEALFAPRDRPIPLWSPAVDDLDFNEIEDQVSDEAWQRAFGVIGSYYGYTVPRLDTSKQEWYERLRHHGDWRASPMGI